MCCMWAPIGSHLRTDGPLPRQDRTPRPRYRHLLWPLIAARCRAAIVAWRARGAVTHIPAAARLRQFASESADYGICANLSRRHRGNAVIVKSCPAQNLHRRKILGWVAIFDFAKLIAFPLA